MFSFLDRQFQLSNKQTSVSKEVLAGLTTFSTLAYIIFVNPAVLSKTGMDYNSVLVATCLAGAIGSLLIGLLSNYPFAQAPGMGLNAFFTYTVVMQLGYTWQQGLAIVFLSGLLFLVLTITGVRARIVRAFPKAILMAIPAGIGLFIALIGFNSSGIVEVNQGPIIDAVLGVAESSPNEVITAIHDAPPQVLQFGDFSSIPILMAILGFFIMVGLLIRKWKGAILITIVLISVIGIVIGENNLPTQWLAWPTLDATWLQLDFNLIGGVEEVSKGARIIDVLTIILAFAMVDLFDSIGTLIGTADKGGFLDKEGRLPKMNKALLADATATVSGALFGTSTTTTYIESATGIAAGGRTGLVSVTVAILFLLCIFITPIAAMIPGYATAPALIVVGIMMMGSLKKIEWEQLDVAVPAFLVIAIIPFAYGIADGIGAGIIAYAFIQLVKNGGKGVSPFIWGIAILFILKFWLLE